jgi:hypothetical protein
MSRADKIKEIAQKIGTRPEWLDALINFETAGTYSPKIKNPYSSARGLIQITDAAAQNIFRASGSLELVNKYPDFYSQMDNVVLPYFLHRKRYYNNNRPFDTKQSLFMAVFYPTYINKPVNTQFPDSVKNVNPGIDTIGDYITKVNSRINPETLQIKASAILPPIIALTAIATIYFIYKRK